MALSFLPLFRNTTNIPHRHKIHKKRSIKSNKKIFHNQFRLIFFSPLSTSLSLSLSLAHFSLFERTLCTRLEHFTSPRRPSFISMQHHIFTSPSSSPSSPLRRSSRTLLTRFGRIERPHHHHDHELPSSRSPH